MGSLFDILPDEKIKGFGGKEYAVPMYLQFVPGYCSEVCHSNKDIFHNSKEHTNTIIAVPHHTDKLFATRDTNFTEDDRYYPLFRTMHDVPTKGDPVLLCTIGGTNYYLGPLNMKTNSPTWNENDFFVPSVSLSNKNAEENTTRGIRGESLCFNRAVDFKRLKKYKKAGLDIPVTNETTGDTIIEGRHGNSLRIGSRSNNPYMIISNDRDYMNSYESLGDGSVISITSAGRLSQHFPSFLDQDGISILGFTLASDSLKEPNRFMGDLISSVNGDQDSSELIYNYGGVDTESENGNTIVDGISANQMLLHSDRITINTKTDDIYLSSIKDIHIGTGRHLTISTNEDLIIESERTFLGNPVINGENREMEPMVKGTVLQDCLKNIVDMIKSMQIMTQLGNQSPIPLSYRQKETQVNRFIETLISNKHFLDE